MSPRSLVPLPGEGLVEALPLPLEPDRRRGEAFLAQGVHRHHVVAAALLPRIGVGEPGRGDRLGSETGDGLLVVAAVHAVDAVSAEALPAVRDPPELAGPPRLAR